MSEYNRALVKKIEKYIKNSSSIEGTAPLIAKELNVANRWAMALLKTLREFKIIKIGRFNLDSSLVSCLVVIKRECSIYEASKKIANIAGITYEEAMKKLRVLAMFKIFNFVDYEELMQEEKEKKEKHSAVANKIKEKNNNKEENVADNLAFIRTCLNQKKPVSQIAIMLSDAMGISPKTALSYLCALKKWGLIAYGADRKFAFEKYYSLAEKCSDEYMSLEDAARIISRESNQKLDTVISMLLALFGLGIVYFPPTTRKKEFVANKKIETGRYKNKLPIPEKKEKNVIIRDTSGELKFKRGINVDPDSCKQKGKIIKVKESEINQVNPYVPLKD